MIDDDEVVEVIEVENILQHLLNEAKILDRILYKSKNQHHSSPSFHLLQTIMRVLKIIAKEKSSSSEFCSKEQKLYKKGKQICQKTFLILRETHLSDLTFIPYTITVMSLLARMNYLFSQLIEI